jgi:hypothetical protein
MHLTFKKKFMKNFRLLMTAAIFLSSHLAAQVQIQTSIPTVGLVQKNQLWNLLLINGSMQSITGRLELIVRDRQTGLEMLSAVTSFFTLPKGSLQVNTNLLNPIQYNYTGMDPNSSINNLLPVGSYNACFLFVKQVADKHDQLAEECISFDVETLSPPMLASPADSSTLEIQPAQFSWIPPTPVEMLRHLNYEILITEIKPGQKANEALQENMPFYNSADLKNNFLSYPAALPAFEKDKWYAWQVVARDESNYAAKTETWTFSVKSPKPKNIEPASVSYILLKSSDNRADIHFITERSLNVKYYSFDKEHDALIRFINSSGQVVQEQKQKISYGDNFLSLKLTNNFSQGQVYTIEITDQQNIKHTALFTIK